MIEVTAVIILSAVMISLSFSPVYLYIFKSGLLKKTAEDLISSREKIKMKELEIKELEVKARLSENYKQLLEMEAPEWIDTKNPEEMKAWIAAKKEVNGGN